MKKTSEHKTIRNGNNTHTKKFIKIFRDISGDEETPTLFVKKN